jgi:hypothetical protein
MKDALQAFLSRYGKDERIILWDLANEPATALRPLVEYVFKWAREVNPSQPLSVCWNAHDLSDVITFHTYMRPGDPGDSRFQVPAASAVRENAILLGLWRFGRSRRGAADRLAGRHRTSEGGHGSWNREPTK